MTLILLWPEAGLLARRRPSRSATRGHSVVLFEREAFPRFHIGESLLSTANDAFAALGVTKQIEAASFPEKWGARLFTHDGQSGRYVDFTNVREVTRPQTYQVSRQEFDRILLERAREVGVHVREACNVTGCEFTPDAAILDVASRVDACDLAFARAGAG